MNRDAVIARLKAVEFDLRKKGVAALYLYGSYARDAARSDSDLDIFVDMMEPELGLSAYMAPYHVIEQNFPGMAIGYGTREDIAPRYRTYIESSAIRVF